MMKVEAIRKLSVEELNKQIAELKEELFELKIKNFLNKLENTAQIGQVKKTIARMMTVLAEKNREVK